MLRPHLAEPVVVPLPPTDTVVRVAGTGIPLVVVGYSPPPSDLPPPQPPRFCLQKGGNLFSRTEMILMERLTTLSCLEEIYFTFDNIQTLSHPLRKTHLLREEVKLTLDLTNDSFAYYALPSLTQKTSSILAEVNDYNLKSKEIRVLLS